MKEKRSITVEERFWGKVRKSSGCWEWTGARSSGYGQISIEGRPVYAHRLSYQIHFGDIPDGLWVLHHCDHPACVNPSHLFLGTYRDNIDDMVAKGRAPGRPILSEEQRQRMLAKTARGERHGNAKLNEDAVREIRQLLAQGQTEQRIANVFGVHPGTVHHVRSGTTWRHVPQDLEILPIPDGYMLANEAAQILGVSASAVREAYRRGVLAGRKTCAHKIIFERVEIERYKRERRYYRSES